MSPAARTEPLPGGGLLSVPGWRAAGAACGLKGDGALDLALLVADSPRTAAGVFTRNRLPAAPVALCRETLASSSRIRSIVINSGNANAMTGAEGQRHAEAMQRRVETRCGGPALVLSTGVIGVPLPVDRVLAGIDEAATRLAPDAEADVADAILTTDTVPKTAAVRAALEGPDGAPPLEVTVGGVAKGSGMIHPRMATMLAVVATDVPVAPSALGSVLRRAVDRSFHEISVDGDTSTNDTVLLLAGGRDMTPIEAGDPRAATLAGAVTDVMQALARKIVHDGEGIRHVLELHVTGARTDTEARDIADAVAGSSLVKTALAGGDPNWGRILAAAANAGVRLDPRKITLHLGGECVYRRGEAVVPDLARVTEAMRQREVRGELDLGSGRGAARRFTTDLTQDYVRINSEYTT